MTRFVHQLDRGSFGGAIAARHAACRTVTATLSINLRHRLVDSKRRGVEPVVHRLAALDSRALPGARSLGGFA